MSSNLASLKLGCGNSRVNWESEMSAINTKTTGSGSKSLILAAMIFAVAMTFIDQTIVSIAARPPWPSS
jgi:hypothetical protein